MAINHKMRDRQRLRDNLQCTSSVTLRDMKPRLLKTVHMYDPASATFTSVIVRVSF